jgi:LuxR family maltose regulon positive regulatory protein
MPEALLRTKLFVPPLRPNLVPRPQLIERLNQGLQLGHKLTLISAPAGFGKTTLATEWLTQLPNHSFETAWLSLDDGDNDLSQFLAYVIVALQTNGVNIGEGVLKRLHSPQPPPMETVLTTLINEITELPGIDDADQCPYILILDDYHLIKAQAIHDALAFLLDHLPPQLLLVIASRTDPPLPLPRLRIRGELIELRVADLRFTPGEIVALFNQALSLDLSAEDIAALDTRTEGWIAGLQVAALSMGGITDVSNFIKAFTGSHRYILDYLVEEVIDRQPEHIQDFLLNTAVLDRMTGPLCNTVTGQNDGQTTLERLERTNLFIVPLDNERQWYRYHHLFSDLLRARLKQSQAELVPELHGRASSWYEQHGFTTEAVRHALAAADFERTARLIEQVGMDMLMHSQFDLLTKWLDQFSEEFLRSRPWLCIMRSWILRRWGRLKELEGYLQSAEQALDSEEVPISNDDQRIIHGQVAALRALIAVHEGNITPAITLSHQALELLPDDYFNRPVASLTLGIAARMNGDLVGSVLALAEARDASRAVGNLFLAQHAIWHLGVTLQVQGRLHQAIESFHEAIEVRYDPEGPLLPAAGSAYVDKGDILREWNELEAAKTHLEEGVKISEPARMMDALIEGYATLTRVHLALGDLDRANDYCIRVKQTIQEVPNPEIEAITQAENCHVHLLVAQGKWAEVARWVQESGLSVDEPDKDQVRKYIILARALVALSQDHLAAYNPFPQAKMPLMEISLTLTDWLLEIVEAMGWAGSIIELLSIRALAFQAKGESEEALKSLQRALTLAEPGGYLRTFVDKGAPMAELLRRALSRGIAPSYVSKLVAAFTKAEVREGASQPSALSPQPIIEPISDREMSVLRLLAVGLSNREIAEELYISVNTVKAHAKNIYSKLGVNGRMQAADRARLLDLL